MIIKFKFLPVVFSIAVLCAGVVLAADETTTTTTTTTSTTPATPATAVKAEPVVDPIQMLQEVTSNVLKALKDNQAKLQSKEISINKVIDTLIFPYVDFNEMSLWVAGKSAWSKASEKQREEFIAAFKTLVVRTYGTALNTYSNETVEFPKQHIDLNKNRIQVRSIVVRTGKDSIHVEYRLIKHENTWLVYDMVVEGVSILQGFQAQFTEEIKQQGLQKVIAKIQEHNKRGDT